MNKLETLHQTFRRPVGLLFNQLGALGNLDVLDQLIFSGLTDPTQRIEIELTPNDCAEP